jgi:hypothetical protein
MLLEINERNLNSSGNSRSEREIMSVGANSSYSAGANRGPKRYGQNYLNGAGNTSSNRSLNHNNSNQLLNQGIGKRAQA